MVAHRVDPLDPLPLYYQVYSSLLQRLRGGEFAVGASLPAERQLAVDYGVSRITATRALSELERDGFVARKQGRGTYVLSLPPDAQPSLSIGQVVMPGAVAPDASRTIAFISQSVGHPYLFSVLNGIGQEAAQRRYHLQVISHYADSAPEELFINDALGRGVQGIIIYPRPGYDSAALYEALAERRFPVVMVDRYYPQAAVDRVVFDDEQAGYDLTAFLINRGHRRIAVVHNYEVDVTSVRERLAGYRRAIQAHGLRYDEGMIWLDVYGDALFGRAGDRAAMRDLFWRHMAEKRPTALLALNNDVTEMAARDLLFLKAERLRGAAGLPPEPVGGAGREVEIATVSYLPRADDIPYVHGWAFQSGETLGSQAARLLIDRLEGGSTLEPRILRVPMQVHPGHAGRIVEVA
jgi:GntR family transcriptional regulator, arabinose operon transcriptional repressor